MKPTVFCLCPVRNNGTILDRFLKAASLWADHIIICDQMSTDNSRQIALSYPKVILIDNPTEQYNEPERQKLLIDKAREFEGPKLLIALDSDEILSPEVLTSAEWETVLNSKPGTLIQFQWANFKPDVKTMWLGYFMAWGYMDDGIAYDNNAKIHSGRIPLPTDHEMLVLNQIKVIHFQYVEWEKMKSKHRFYLCYETLAFPNKSALQLFRTYHHMYEITDDQTIPIPTSWIEEYNKLGVDITSMSLEPINWFDIQVLKMIEEHGASRFKKIRIWDKNMIETAKMLKFENLNQFKDPRNKFDRKIQKILFKTQTMQNKLYVRLLEKFIVLFFKY